jgi:hypothetical protein
VQRVHVANTLDEVVGDDHVDAGHVCRHAAQDALKLLHPRSLHSTVFSPLDVLSALLDVLLAQLDVRLLARPGQSSF